MLTASALVSSAVIAGCAPSPDSLNGRSADKEAQTPTPTPASLNLSAEHPLTEVEPGDSLTFTVTNGGVYGSLMSTPILNAPQSGILGMHKIQERPMAVGGKIEIRPMMYLALSYDHRIVDGKEAVTFLVRLKEHLEDPQRVLLDL